LASFTTVFKASVALKALMILVANGFKGANLVCLIYISKLQFSCRKQTAQKTTLKLLNYSHDNYFF
jgi:hypothetical protein